MIAERWNYRLLRRISLSLGAGLFGVADISGIKEEFFLTEDATRGLDRAVCVGARLSLPVLSEIKEEPTRLYLHHYRTANMFLDQMAYVLCQRIQERGARALPIPASQIIDWDLQKAHLSHKRIGYLAGLGWMGRNNLLVSKNFGSQFRMVTILTDLSLKPDRPVREECGTCYACLKACPVGAIGERQEDFKYEACFEKLKSFQRQNIVGQFICGICVKACSGGQNAPRRLP